MATRFKKVMRRIDAHHIFYGWNKQLARQTEVLEEAWLNCETQETYLERPEETAPKPAPKAAAPRKPRKKRATKKATAKRAEPEVTLPPSEELDDEFGLGSL